MRCKNTGKVLNTIPSNERESISNCISKENKGSESTVFLAEELVNLYQSVYKGTSKKYLLFLYRLLLRVLENGSDRYIDIVESPFIPIKKAGLRRVVERLEALQIVELYIGWSKSTGAVPACIRAAYSPEELKIRAKLALERKIDNI